MVNKGLEKLQRQYIKHFALLVLCSLLSFAVSHSFYDWESTLKIFVFPLLLFYALYYFFNNYPFNFELVFRLGFYGFVVYILTLLILFSREPAVYGWLIVPVLAINMVGTIKETIFWLLIMLLIAGAAVFITDWLLTELPFSSDILPDVVLLRYIIVANCAAFIAFLLYYTRRFNEARSIVTRELNGELTQTVMPNTESNQITVDDQREDKYAELYKRVETFFNAGYGFKSPQYTVEKLAADLKSNPRYVSKAIKLNTGMNFKSFINHHRIQVVKLMLNAGDHKRYTLSHIYSSVGFVNQSTFNRVFKEVERVTPSQYIESLK